MVLEPNSTPIVRSCTGWKRLSVNCNNKHDLPTANRFNLVSKSNKQKISLCVYIDCTSVSYNDVLEEVFVWQRRTSRDAGSSRLSTAAARHLAQTRRRDTDWPYKTKLFVENMRAVCNAFLLQSQEKETSSNYCVNQCDPHTI